MDGKKYLSMNHPRQKIPEFESSPVKNCWGPMTPVKIWAWTCFPAEKKQSSGHLAGVYFGKLIELPAAVTLGAGGGSRVHFNWEKVWLLRWVVGTFRITKKSGPFFGLWSVPIFGPPGVKRGSKGGQNCPFLIKSSQETENLHFYVKSHEKSDGGIHLWQFSKFDSFWGPRGSKRGQKGVKTALFW